MEMMKNGPYSLATDGSSDNGLKKQNPLTVKIYDANLKKIKSSFLDMCLSSGRTAEMLFQEINSCLSTLEIPWENCVAFSVDSTNTNVGQHNSIMTRVLEKNDSVYFSRCQCHMVHNASSEGAKAFTTVTGFDVEDLVVDIFYWFDRSTKRKSKLAEYTYFCDQEFRKIIKHVSTRWLSLEKAVTRILQQYASLKSYFLSEDEPVSRFKRIQTAFSNPMTEVYLMFYQSALQVFIQLNLFLQREDPLIGAVNSSLMRFIKLLSCKFVPTAVVNASISFQHLLDTDQYLPGIDFLLSMSTF